MNRSPKRSSKKSPRPVVKTDIKQLTKNSDNTIKILKNLIKQDSPLEKSLSTALSTVGLQGTVKRIISKRVSKTVSNKLSNDKKYLRIIRDEIVKEFPKVKKDLGLKLVPRTPRM